MNTSSLPSPFRFHHIGRRLAVLALAACTAVILSSCAAFSAGNTAKDPEGRIVVATSFYPIQWLTQYIGGSYVIATSITPENVEPHDFELAPKDITELSSSQVVIYMPGFQPSLDDAVASIDGPAVLDLSKTVTLESSEAKETGENEVEDASEHNSANHESEHESHNHLEHNHSEHSHHSHAGAADPHFWLDPIRMKEAAEAISSELSHVDPDHADAYTASASKLSQELEALDSNYSAKLSKCTSPIILSSHEAFGYLARRYHLEQAAISGIDPEAEPSPAQLHSLAQIAASHKATTIFTESTLSAKAAKVLAEEAGLKTETLSTLETAPAHGDYLSQMQENLTKLSAALGCTAP